MTTLAAAEIRLRIVEAVLPRLTFPEVKRPGELLEALRDVEAWVREGCPSEAAPAVLSQPLPASPVVVPLRPARPAEPTSTLPAIERTIDRTAEPNTRQRAMSLLTLLEVFARDGIPMGSNATIARRLGWADDYSGTAAVSNALTALKASGSIRVEAVGAGAAMKRRAFVTSMEKWTPWDEAGDQAPALKPTGEERLFQILVDLATRGAVLPDNETLATLSGVKGGTSISAHLSVLNSSGRIVVERRGRVRTPSYVRRVSIPSLGIATAWPPETPDEPAPAADDEPHRSTLRRFPSVAPQPERVSGLKPDHPAVTGARTLFPSTVVEVADSPRLLVSGHNSRKIGKAVEKGPWRGMPIYTLTLEERATCPTSCHRWSECYGNAMPFARRHRHGPDLISYLHAELIDLQDEHPDGFVVRLHVLGDFWSAEYAQEWATWLAEFPALHVFGYTAHAADSEIGGVVRISNEARPTRHRILFSVAADAPFAAGQAISVRTTEEAGDATICPAETGATEACATCGLCWNPAATQDKRIAFLLHGLMRGPRKAKASTDDMAPSGAPGLRQADNAGTATAPKLPPGGRQGTPSRDEARPSREPVAQRTMRDGERYSSIPASPPPIPAPPRVSASDRRHEAAKRVNPADLELIGAAVADGRVTRIPTAMAHGAVDLIDRLQRTLPAGDGKP